MKPAGREKKNTWNNKERTIEKEMFQAAPGKMVRVKQLGKQTS